MDLMIRRREMMKGYRNILSGLDLAYSNVASAIYPYNYGDVVAYSAIGRACLTFIDVSLFRGKTLILNHRPTGNRGGIAFYSDVKKTSNTYRDIYVSGLYNRNVNTQGEWKFQVPTGNNVNYMRFTANPNYIDDVQIILIE